MEVNKYKYYMPQCLTYLPPAGITFLGTSLKTYDNLKGMGLCLMGGGDGHRARSAMLYDARCSVIAFVFALPRGTQPQSKIAQEGVFPRGKRTLPPGGFLWNQLGRKGCLIHWVGLLHINWTKIWEGVDEG